MTGQANQYVGSTWTVERLVRVKTLWAAGASQSEIAAELGVTRNAIAGKIDRLGLTHARKPRKARPSRVGKVKPPSPERMTPFRAPIKSVGLSEQPTGCTVTVDVLDDLPSDGGGLPLVELTNTTCRWPLGPTMAPAERFCGCAGADLAAGKPYCRHHTRMARRV